MGEKELVVETGTPPPSGDNRRPQRGDGVEASGADLDAAVRAPVEEDEIVVVNEKPNTADKNGQQRAEVATSSDTTATAPILDIEESDDTVIGGADGADLIGAQEKPAQRKGATFVKPGTGTGEKSTAKAALSGEKAVVQPNSGGGFWNWILGVPATPENQTKTSGSGAGYGQPVNKSGHGQSTDTQQDMTAREVAVHNYNAANEPKESFWGNRTIPPDRNGKQPYYPPVHAGPAHAPASSPAKVKPGHCPQCSSELQEGSCAVCGWGKKRPGASWYEGRQIHTPVNEIHHKWIGPADHAGTGKIYRYDHATGKQVEQPRVTHATPAWSYAQREKGLLIETPTVPGVRNWGTEGEGGITVNPDKTLGASKLGTTCLRCFKENEKGSSFCNRCGQPLFYADGVFKRMFYALTRPVTVHMLDPWIRNNPDVEKLKEQGCPTCYASSERIKAVHLQCTRCSQEFDAVYPIQNLVTPQATSQCNQEVKTAEVVAVPVTTSDTAIAEPVQQPPKPRPQNCTHCNAIVPPTGDFCGSCGSPIGNEFVLNANLCSTCNAGPGCIDIKGFCTSCGAKRRNVTDRNHWELKIADNVVGLSDRGLVHGRNEDSMAARQETNRRAVAVSDGVSSSQSPQDASQAAADAAVSVLAEAEIQKDSLDELMITAISQAADAVRALPYNSANTTLTGPDATIVVSLILEDVIKVAWVGDSRAYWVRPDWTVIQLTKDHSWLSDAIDKGMAKEEAEQHQFAHSITRSLGGQRADCGFPPVQPDIATLNLTECGYLLLCSDGVWNYAHEELSAILQSVSESGLEGMTNALVQFANENGGQDNITVIIARVNLPEPVTEEEVVEVDSAEPTEQI